MIVHDNYILIGPIGSDLGYHVAAYLLTMPEALSQFAIETPAEPPALWAGEPEHTIYLRFETKGQASTVLEIDL